LVIDIDDEADGWKVSEDGCELRWNSHGDASNLRRAMCAVLDARVRYTQSTEK